MYIGVGEAAKILGKSTDLVRWLEKTGKIKSVRVGKKNNRRFLLSDIQSLALERASPEYVKQTLLCPNCKNFVAVKMVKKRPNIMLERIGSKRCHDCIEKQKKNNSLRMSRMNPMKQEGVAEKVSSTLKKKYSEGVIAVCHSTETKEKIKDGINAFWNSEKAESVKIRFFERMSQNNPMSIRSIVEKVHSKLKAMRDKGEFVTPKGINHWLWKGNRGFYSFVRSQLYRPWSLEVLKRDGFCCSSCGKTQCELHVHHVRPFRDIVKKVLFEEKIDAKNLEKLKDIWQDLSDKVLREHKLEDGVSVCVYCHGKIDSRYRRYKGED